MVGQLYVLLPRFFKMKNTKMCRIKYCWLHLHLDLYIVFVAFSLLFFYIFTSFVMFTIMLYKHTGIFVNLTLAADLTVVCRNRFFRHRSPAMAQP